ncbi:MAG: hypothetical protein GFH27_549285n371 [Chloroflexi bacterium AL-W]|nr:hypothetical protein [Chloroflexi bacterium AL-N1]NOK65882.1 hypothetical protein [Chloroflexi bacterium AL-N10]NOK74177.1 hypothetical protein [Chloroflexi bacterium AL-N5]NOK80915.1 hypothetical protein [Chloroflexi bacterium AL-W]NOK88435.1 hypothetical protein [Chloroflexi bacterium AL-N15]
MAIRLYGRLIHDGTNLRRIMIALHLESFPFRDKAKMEQILSKLVTRHPGVQERCYELIAARNALGE